MTNKKANVLMIVGLFVLIGMIGGLTIAFFNYTRTGSVNLLSTGDISFNSDYDTVTISNVFPISTEDIGTDTDNVAEVEINVSGSTTYTNGIEYLIKAVNLDGNLRNVIGISVDAEDLGTKVSNENYFKNREGASTSLVTTYQKLNENGYIAAGFIKSGATGVDGTITLKAYINKDKIAITDTIENGAIVASGYDNGTTAAWINGRYTMTTSEWNALQTNGISFKIKVEANEGVWVVPSLEDVNIMGKFPNSILDHKSEVKEIYFEQMTQSEIDTRYNAATVKADIAIDGSVPCWLEGDKLYVASPNTIYMSTGNGLFAVLNVKKIVFNNIDTTTVTDMMAMFLGCNYLENIVNLNSFNTRNVINMSYMFDYCRNLSNLDLSGFSTNNVTDMTGMFEGCTNLTVLDLSSFDTSNVTMMSSMYNGCSSLTGIIGLTGFNTTNVTEMGGMFQSCSSLTNLDLSSFNTSRVIGMTNMFDDCLSIITIYVSNLWTISSLNISWGGLNMFGADASRYTSNLVGGAGTAFDSNHIDKEYARIDDPTNGKPGYFTYKAAPSA